MLGPVRAQLHVHAGESRHPERAAQTIAAELLSSFPRQRAVTLAILALGPHPGLTPTPWMLDGLLAALIEAERTPVNFVTFGDHESAEMLLRKAGREGPITGEELIERPSRDRAVDLRPAGQPRALRIPREIIGSSLVVCAPACFGAREQGPARRWHGPVATSLASFARGYGFRPAAPKLGKGLRPRPDSDSEQAAALGHELLGACFASAAILLDATWAAALEAPPGPASTARPRGPDGRFIRVARREREVEPATPRLLGELAAPERILGLAELGHLELEDLLGVDHWLAAALGLEPRPREHTPELVRSPGRWPTLSPPPMRSQPKRLADRAISGIRSQSQRLRGAAEPAALPGRVPGEFAQLWTRRWYGEHDLARALRRPGARVELR
jgi:hypothetical protein